MLEPERLLLIFEHSPEESGLTGVREVVRALEQNGVGVRIVARNPGVDSLIGRVLRFWFPYLASAGITGVVSGAAEAGEFIIPLTPGPDPVFVTELGAWLQQPYGRKIRVRFHDIEMEAQTPEQVEALWARLEGLRQSREAATPVP